MKELNLGAILKAMRVRRGFDQAEMAFQMDRSQSEISKLENEYKEPGFKTILRWAEVTNAREVLVAYLCGMDGLSIMQNILPYIGG